MKKHIKKRIEKLLQQLFNTFSLLGNAISKPSFYLIKMIAFPPIMVN